METIIAQPGRDAHPDPDSAARQRADRLARATSDQMEAALAYLSMIDPEAFEIALTAATPDIRRGALRFLTWPPVVTNTPPAALTTT
jgi:hypothetical protein